jgi:hypothetical protein
MYSFPNLPGYHSVDLGGRRIIKKKKEGWAEIEFKIPCQIEETVYPCAPHALPHPGGHSTAANRPQKWNRPQSHARSFHHSATRTNVSYSLLKTSSLASRRTDVSPSRHVFRPIAKPAAWPKERKRKNGQ